MADLLLDLLRSEGILSEAQLRPALARAAEANEDLASALWYLKLLNEGELVRLLGRLHGFPGVDLSRTVVPLKNLDVLPEEQMRKKGVFPVRDLDDELVVAMAAPEDSALLDELWFVTGRKVLPHIAVPSALRAAIEQALKLRTSGEQFWRGKEVWTAVPQAQGRVEIVRPGAEEPLPVIEGSPDDALPVVGLLDPLFEAEELPPTPAPPPAGPARAAAIDLPQEGNPTLKVEGLGVGKVALVVEDDPEIRALMVKVLEPFRCAVLQAGDGQQGLQLCREARPDLVLLDAMLPGMHGFEVCRAIKGDPQLRRAVVIMVSGVYTGWKIGVDLREAFGANAFIEKPFHLDELARAVRSYLLGGSDDPAVQQARRATALKLCEEAAAQVRDGKLDEAIVLFRAAVDKDAFSAEPHFYLGRVLRSKGEPYRALACFERAAELRPDLDQPLIQLGELYESLGFKKTAREVLARALGVCKEASRAEEIQAQLSRLSAP